MNKQIAALVVLVLLLAAIMFASGFSFKSASAVNSHNMSGWAWSSDAGWIAFNCNSIGSGQDLNGDTICDTGPDYGVTIDTTQTPSPMSGYAWSSIGWISFNSSELTGCPDGTCLAQLDSVAGGVRKMSGWARACAVFVTGCSGALKTDGSLGGWAGFISLSPKVGDTIAYDPAVNCRVAPGSVPPGCFGVRMDTTGGNANNFSGFAWGDEVLGWINFAPLVTGVAPVALQNGVTATLSSTLLTDGATTLTWNGFGTTGASPCALTSSPATPSWDNPAVASTGSKIISPLVATTFTVICTGNSTMSPPANVAINPPVITLFSSNINPANPNQSVNITTTEAGGFSPVMSCVKGGAWSGTTGQGTNVLAVTVGASDTSYTLRCTDAGGQTTPLKTLVVTVNVPNFNVNAPAAAMLVSFVSDKPETTANKATVGVNAVTGFATPITLSLLPNTASCTSGSSAVTAHFGSRTGAATAQISSPYSATQDLYVTFTSAVSAGTCTVTLRAVGSTKTVDTPITVTVQSFKPVPREQ